MRDPKPYHASPLYPVGLVLAGQPCLVVGGGAVAGSKVCGLVECGATVTLIAPAVHDALAVIGASGVLDKIDENPIHVHLRPYEPGEAAQYRLVVTTTGIGEVDSMVRRDADAANVWVNSTDDPANCSFLAPSVYRDGPVTIAVSTGGASPALAVWLRRRIGELVESELLGQGLGTIADMLGKTRRALRDEGISTEDVDWAGLLDGELPGLVRARRLDEARALIDGHVGTQTRDH